MTRENFTMNYAAQCVRVEKKDGALKVLAATRPVRSRGETLNGAILEVEFTAPRENIIRVRVTHFAGKQDRAPHFAVFEENVNPAIAESEEAACFTSGGLTAKVLKAEGRWQVDFLGRNGQVLTTSGFRAMAHALDRNTGKTYMSDSLMLDVGECVYGLGERFTPYVKNGQSVDMWNADGGTASELAYKNIPFYMTNRGYGIFVEDTSDVSFEIASEKVERAQFSVEGETLVYDVIYGETPKGVLDLYTALTGRPSCRHGASACGCPPPLPRIMTRKPPAALSTAWPSGIFPCPCSILTVSGCGAITGATSNGIRKPSRIRKAC